VPMPSWFTVLIAMIIILVDLWLAEFDVGLITVDMSINVTYPNLKPHLHELAELIAKELEIDSRQVLRIRSMQQLGCASYAIGSSCKIVKCLMYCIGEGYIYRETYGTLTLMGRQPNSGASPSTDTYRNTHSNISRSH
jgi:hypothetical protein